METEEDKKDFIPLEGKLGDFYIWKGSKLTHGNKINKSGHSRVSFDFRFIPYSKYDPNFDKSTITQSRRLVLGDYYSLCNKK